MQQFEQAQKSYYLDEINRAMPGRGSTLDAQAIALALGGDSPVGEPAVPAITSRLVSEFGGNSPAHQREQTCRAVRDPATMRPNVDDRTGCGWYFRASPSVPSTAAYGTRRGPMNPHMGTAGAGEWIWNPEEAAAKESGKVTANVAACADIGIASAQYPNLGWCTTTNRAIIHDGRGQPRFPRSPGGDCPGGQIITNAAQCPPRQADNGFGFGSGFRQSVSDICEPAANGSLSPGCLRALTTQVCSPNGLLAQSLSGAGYAGDVDEFNAVNSVLVRRNFEIPAGILRGGNVTREAALSTVNQLKQMSGSGFGTGSGRDAAAASRMCFGTPFDPCAYVDSDTKPFEMSCLQREAMRAGWSPNGEMFPGRNAEATNYWNQFQTWADVKVHLRHWKTYADNPGQKQPPSLKWVYGVNVKNPAFGCNTQGVLMLRYLVPSNVAYRDETPQGHFLGRYIFKNGLPNGIKGNADQTEAGSFPHEMQRMITAFVPSQGGNYQFLIELRNNVTMTLDNRKIAEGANSVLSSIVPLVAHQRYTITWDVYHASDVWMFSCMFSVNGAAWRPLPADQLFMPYDRRLPALELAFNKMPDSGVQLRDVRDTHRILDNLQMSAPIRELAGRRCMIVGEGSGVMNFKFWNQGIRAYAMKSYTAMMLIRSVAYPSGVTPSLFGFYNTRSADPRGALRHHHPQEPWDYAQQKDNLMLTSGGTNVYGWGKSATDPAVYRQFITNAAQAVPIPTGSWFHFAWIWDENLGGYAFWINGQLAQKFASVPFASSQIMEQIRIGTDTTGDGSAWSGGMAWFRGFDYRLNEEQIRRDMNDDWGSLA
jgi:hypothetical protein